MERTGSAAPKSRGREVIEGLLGLVLLVAIGAGVWNFFFGADEPNEAAAKAETRAPGRHLMREASFGCVSPNAFREASDYWINHDSALFKGMFANGACEVLTKGEEVILVDVKFMDYVVVRRPGDPTRLVTFISVLD